MEETPLLVENTTFEQTPSDTTPSSPPDDEKPQRDWLGAGVYFPRRLALALMTLVAAWLLLLFLRDQLPLGRLGEGADWDFSWRMRMPVSELVGERLGNTLRLLGAAVGVGWIGSMFYAVVALMIHYAGRRIPPLGSALHGLGRLCVFGNAAAPVFVAGLFSLLLFSLTFSEHNWPYLPAGGLFSMGSPAEGSILGRLGAEPGSNLDRLVHLIQPTLTLALLGSVLTGQVVARELTRRREQGTHLFTLVRLPLVALAALLGQIGGLLSASVLVELIFAYPGLGRLVVDAAQARDYPVLMRVALVYLFIGVGVRLLADLLQTLDRLVTTWQGEEQEEAPLDWQRTARRAWLAVGLVALLILLALGLWGLGGDKDEALYTSLDERLVEPGDRHALGTDELGRDVQARLRVAIPLTLRTGALAAGIAWFVGGAWGVAAGLIAGWLGESLADLLLWPADVLMAVPPLALLLILVLITTQDQEGTVPSGMIFALALLLTPRAARATRNLVLGRPPGHRVSVSLVVGLLAVGLGLFYAAILFGTALDFVGLGVQPPDPTLGNMLGSGTQVLFRARYLVLIPGIALIVLLYPLYLTANVLMDVLDLRTKDVLTEFNK
jgi:ABC-type dipeptide/oligopeptide/nickel transport system permease subunit